MGYKTYYAILSGQHPTLPHGELVGILDAEAMSYRIIARLTGATVFEADLPSGPHIITERAGWVKEVGLLWALVEAEEEQILGSASSLVEARGPPRRVAYKRFKRMSQHIDDARLKHTLKTLAHTNGTYELRVFISEGAAIIGIVMARLDTRALYYRSPGRRPFFRPGPLSPNLTRAMINLSRLRRGDTYLDPFCGTGGFALEACLIGAGRCYCGDISGDMVRGSRINLAHYKVYSRCLVMAATATSIPLRDETIGALATDPPYGRSTTTKGRDYRVLVRRFLEEAARVVRRGSYIVYAGPLSGRPSELAEDAGLQVVDRYHMHVHGSLTREVVVAIRR
ncbi:MAG: RsmD family RNA methyltransferase [Desulfurococcales archaeon]|nr:RsmD family RNA methyltransferase [Desulfurococcales archaeon]